MIRTVAIIAAVAALGATPALAGGPYTLDAQGKCRGADHKFAKAALCVKHTYAMDAKGKCRDERHKFAPMSACKM